MPNDDKNFIKKAIKNPGALSKALGAKDGTPITEAKMKNALKKLRDKAKGDKKLNPNERTMLRRLVLAKTLSKMRPNKKKRSLMDAADIMNGDGA